MMSRKRVLWIVVAAVAASAVLAVVVLAQSTGTQSGTAVRKDFWARVAANLGISREALVAAVDQAEIQMIDEALAAGLITEEQAQWMKIRVEARRAMDEVIGQALAEGKITEDQWALWGRYRGLAKGRGVLGRGWGMGYPGCMGR